MGAARLTVPLAGEGVDPATTTTTSPNTPFSIGPRDLSFGEVTVGASRTRTVTITNNTQATLSGFILLVIVPTGEATTATWNHYDECANATLGPGDSCLILVRFAPRAEGSVLTQLHVAFKQGISGGGEYFVPLRAVGVASPTASTTTTDVTATSAADTTTTMPSDSTSPPGNEHRHRRDGTGDHGRHRRPDNRIDGCRRFGDLHGTRTGRVGDDHERRDRLRRHIARRLRHNGHTTASHRRQSLDRRQPRRRPDPSMSSRPPATRRMPATATTTTGPTPAAPTVCSSSPCSIRATRTARSPSTAPTFNPPPTVERANETHRGSRAGAGEANRASLGDACRSDRRRRWEHCRGHDRRSLRRR